MKINDFSATASVLLSAWLWIRASASPASELLTGYSTISRREDAVSNRKSSGCNALSNALPGAVEFPGTPLYAADNIYWANTSDVTPYCILTPSNNSEVATAIEILEETYTEFAIRSGGHSQIKGWSGTDSGVTINLRKFNEVELLENNTLAKIGVGARWRDVYETLEEKGFTVPGGRSGDVGVGGYTLGGGISYYVLTHGLAVDNIVSFEVVLASGSVVTASTSSEPELFFALKGSGNNFGIVTSITFRTIPLHTSNKIWGGQLVTFESTFPTVLNGFHDFAERGSVEDTGTHIIISFGWSRELNASIAAMVLFDEDPTVAEQGGPEVFKNLTALADDETLVYANTLGVRGMANLSREVAAEGEGTRQEMRTFTLENPDLDLLTQLLNLQQAEFKEISPKVEGLSAFLVIMVIRVGASVNGGNPLGLKEGVTYVIGQLYTQWINAKDDELVYATSQKIWDAGYELAEEKGMAGSYLYMNYASEVQDVFESYGQDNMEKLISIKNTYDPTNVFGTLVKGGFKLPVD